MAAMLAEVHGKLDEQAKRLAQLREDFKQYAESTETVFEAMADVVGDLVAQLDVGEIRTSLSMETNPNAKPKTMKFPMETPIAMFLFNLCPRCP